MPLSNDERGWVMSGLSGLACIVGASVICIDVLVRLFPGKKNFRIQDSDTFLSASLSLSFGVMLFSSLYSMLPSAKSSLVNGGYSSKQASWILISSFIGGVLGIQVISNILHRFVPSHVVDCEHSHEDDEEEAKGDNAEHHGPKRPSQARTSSLPGHTTLATGRRAVSAHAGSYAGGDYSILQTVPHDNNALTMTASMPYGISRRPSLHSRLTSGLASIASPKLKCDCDRPCRGFSDPCGDDCFKKVRARGGTKFGPKRSISCLRRPPLMKSFTEQEVVVVSENTPLLQEIAEEASRGSQSRSTSHTSTPANEAVADDLEGTHSHTNGDPNQLHTTQSRDSTTSHHADHHHHHVPNNAFLAIGLQTSIAIALHKLPEGFITYATNHANPKLGVSVFLALFIHNITEGFALALPLYLAINSRAKAMFWSFVLGGLSQPAGAGVAALWFKIAGNSGFAPSEAVYGGMFAVTAGIMASVALQLFSESLDLTHSRALCMVGAFSGMAILGISSALTA